MGHDLCKPLHPSRDIPLDEPTGNGEPLVIAAKARRIRPTGIDYLT